MFRIEPLALFLLGLVQLTSLTAQTDEGTAGVFGDAGGRLTASGEVYDPDSLTGGSPSLRFGLRLAVTNPANGRVVTVRVNDRGPSPPGQVLNLSRAAAQALGIHPGDRVRIRALRADQPDETSLGIPPPPPPPSGFVPTPPPSAWVQLGAFRTEGNAQRLAHSLVAEGFDPKIRHQGVVFRVYLSTPETELAGLLSHLSDLGHRGYLEVAREPDGATIDLSTP